MKQSPYNEFKALHAIKVTPSKNHEKCPFCKKIIFSHLVNYNDKQIKFCPKCGQIIPGEEIVIDEKSIKVKKSIKKC